MERWQLQQQIPRATWALLEQYDFDFETFAALRARAQQGADQNRIRSALATPESSDVRALPAPGTAGRASLTARGEAALRDGQVGTLVLAGGMATRFGGAVKAMVEAVEQRSFLELKHLDLLRLGRRLKARIPLCVMSSFATHAQLAGAASSLTSSEVPLYVFPQSISLRLNRDGSLFIGADHMPSPYAPGHGDLAACLTKSGTLTMLQQQGVRYLFMTNVDNLAATLDPALIGAHLEQQNAMSFEVTTPRLEDQGGRPLRLDGKLQIIEALRFPPGFRLELVPWFSTNSFVFDLAALAHPFDLSWFFVEKIVDRRPAVQFERLVNQLSAFLPCQGIAVAREGDDGRFVPIKEPSDLETHRAELKALLRRRGVLAT